MPVADDERRAQTLLALFAAALTAVSLSSGTDARAASERVQVSVVRHGVLIRVYSRARAVDFRLGGRLLAGAREGLWTGTAAKGALLEDVRVVESEPGVDAEHYNS